MRFVLVDEVGNSRRTDISSDSPGDDILSAAACVLCGRIRARHGCAASNSLPHSTRTAYSGRHDEVVVHQQAEPADAGR